MKNWKEVYNHDCKVIIRESTFSLQNEIKVIVYWWIYEETFHCDIWYRMFETSKDVLLFEWMYIRIAIKFLDPYSYDFNILSIKVRWNHKTSLPVYEKAERAYLLWETIEIKEILDDDIPYPCTKIIAEQKDIEIENKSRWIIKIKWFAKKIKKEQCKCKLL